MTIEHTFNEFAEGKNLNTNPFQQEDGKLYLRYDGLQIRNNDAGINNRCNYFLVMLKTKCADKVREAKVLLNYQQKRVQILTLMWICSL